MNLSSISTHLLYLTSLLFFVSCSAANRDAEIEQAWKLLEAGRSEKALMRFNELEKEVPENIRLLSGQVVALSQISSISSAEAKAKRIIELAPGRFDAHYSLGILQLKLGKSASAVKSFTTALKLRPGWIEPIWNRGTAYDELAQWDKAIIDYDKALSLQPNRADILSNRGHTKYKQQDYEGSLADLCKALTISPGQSKAQSNLDHLLSIIHSKDLKLNTECR